MNPAPRSGPAADDASTRPAHASHSSGKFAASVELTRALAHELLSLLRGLEALGPAAPPLTPRIQRTVRLVQRWLAQAGDVAQPRLEDERASERGGGRAGAGAQAGVGGAVAAVALVHRLERLKARCRELEQRLVSREPGRLHLVTGTVDLVASAHRCLETVRPLADARNLTLAVSMPTTGEPIWAAAEASLVQQTLELLLRGMVESAPAAGLLCIAARYEGDRAVIELQDSGAALPAAAGARAQPEQASERATDLAAGIAAVLPHVRRLAMQSGGQLVAGPVVGGVRHFALRLPRPLP
ncbi:MAG: hypothetical protein HY561_07115 [Gemmatimonadetes bacterium]|nr:hypothetical protein [Gemmatimonadota bacterium]